MKSTKGGSFFNRYGGPMADILFTLLYALILPALTGRAANAAGRVPEYYLYIGSAAILLYPLACAAMLQKIATEPMLRQGILSLHEFLWKRFTWPLGMLFWLSLICHSVFMASIPAAGESLYMEAGRYARGFEYWLTVSSMILFSIITAFIVFRAGGFKLRNPFHRDDSEKVGTGLKIFTTIAVIVLAPMVLFLAASAVVIVPFLLYALVWGFSIHKIKKGEDIPRLIGSGRVSAAVSSILIVCYAATVTFFLDIFVSMQPAVMQGSSTAARVLVLAVLMMYFYIPYRAFFALYSGRRILGWITFAVNIAVVVYETWGRIGGG